MLFRCVEASLHFGQSFALEWRAKTSNSSPCHPTQDSLLDTNPENFSSDTNSLQRPKCTLMSDRNEFPIHSWRLDLNVNKYLRGSEWQAEWIGQYWGIYLFFKSVTTEGSNRGVNSSKLRCNSGCPIISLELWKQYHDNKTIIMILNIKWTCIRGSMWEAKWSHSQLNLAERGHSTGIEEEKREIDTNCWLQKTHVLRDGIVVHFNILITNVIVRREAHFT
jgi:hypothetical protein